MVKGANVMNNNDNEKKLILPEIKNEKCKIRKTVVDKNGLTHEVEEIIELPVFDEDEEE